MMTEAWLRVESCRLSKKKRLKRRMKNFSEHLVGADRQREEMEREREREDVRSQSCHLPSLLFWLWGLIILMSNPITSEFDTFLKAGYKLAFIFVMHSCCGFFFLFFFYIRKKDLFLICTQWCSSSSESRHESIRLLTLMWLTRFDYWKQRVM